MLGEGRQSLRYTIRCIGKFHPWRGLWGSVKRENLVPGILVLIESPSNRRCGSGIWVGVIPRVRCGSSGILSWSYQLKMLGLRITYPMKRLWFKFWIVKFTSWELRKLYQSRSFGGTNLLKKQLGKLRRIWRRDIHISLNPERMHIKVLSSIFST